jgi:hypothetical protein
MRIGRGLYVLTVPSSFGMLPPEPHKVIEFLERETSEPIVAHGIAAANQLGLTTQVPMRRLYITAGRALQLSFGKSVVEVRNVPRWLMALPHRPGGDAIRALEWLGEVHAPAALERLRATLAGDEWLALVGARPRLPEWLAAAIGVQAQKHYRTVG